MEKRDFLSFNWATEFYPWKLGRILRDCIDHPPLQLGHGILSVETANQLKLLFLKASELQLGHGILSVETPRRGAICFTNYIASIGPRNFIRGNTKILKKSLKKKRMLQLGHGILSVETYWDGSDWAEYTGFNWATEFYPWKPATSMRCQTTDTCFNWATEFYPWKP